MYLPQRTQRQSDSLAHIAKKKPLLILQTHKRSGQIYLHLQTKYSIRLLFLGADLVRRC